MTDDNVQQAQAWLKIHKPHTVEQLDAMDAEARRLYKYNMDIVKAHLDAWLQERDPEGYAALLAEANRGM